MSNTRSAMENLIGNATGAVEGIVAIETDAEGAPTRVVVESAGVLAQIMKTITETPGNALSVLRKRFPQLKLVPQL